MTVEPVDERDSAWEQHHPRFRVYLFHTDHPGNPWATATFDLTDTDVLGAISWATQQAGQRDLYAVAIVSDDREGRRGLTWLVGRDANDAPWDTRGHMVARDPQQQDVIDRMVARRGTSSPEA